MTRALRLLALATVLLAIPADARAAGEIVFQADLPGEQVIERMDADGGNRVPIVEAAGAPLRGRDPDVSPDGTRIAFTRDGDVFVIPIEGGEARRVRQTDVNEREPAWTPDGARLVVVAEDNSGPGRPMRLVVLNAETGAEERELVSATDLATPAVSADGATVAYAATDSAAYRVYSRAFDGSGAASPLGDPGGYHPDYSADGRLLALEQGNQIVVGPVGGALVAVTTGYQPRLSPDGRSLLFTRSGQVAIATLPAGDTTWNGDEPVTVLTSGGTYGASRATWATAAAAPPGGPPATPPPTGPVAPTSFHPGRLFFSGARAGGSEIFSIEPSGEGLRRLTTDGGRFPDVSLPGSSAPQRVVYIRPRTADRPVAIFTMSPDGSNKRPFAAAGLPLEPIQAVWAPSGGAVAIVADPRRTASGIFLATEGGGTRRVTFPLGGAKDTAPAFSRNGTQLAFIRTERDDFAVSVSRLCVADLRTTADARCSVTGAELRTAADVTQADCDRIPEPESNRSCVRLGILITGLAHRGAPMFDEAGGAGEEIVTPGALGQTNGFAVSGLYADSSPPSRYPLTPVGVAPGPTDLKLRQENHHDSNIRQVAMVPGAELYAVLRTHLGRPTRDSLAIGRRGSPTVARPSWKAPVAMAISDLGLVSWLSWQAVVRPPSDGFAGRFGSGAPAVSVGRVRLRRGQTLVAVANRERFRLTGAATLIPGRARSSAARCRGKARSFAVRARRSATVRLRRTTARRATLCLRLVDRTGAAKVVRRTVRVR